MVFLSPLNVTRMWKRGQEKKKKRQNENYLQSKRTEKLSRRGWGKGVMDNGCMSLISRPTYYSPSTFSCVSFFFPSFFFSLIFFFLLFYNLF